MDTQPPAGAKVVPWPSFASLWLQLRQGETPIGHATGFVVRRGDRDFLLTNRHVLCGITETGITPPDNVVIMHNADFQLGFWLPVHERLYDDSGSPRWFEHPSGPDVDVAALPLRTVRGVKIFPHDPWQADRGIATGVSEPLSIIGFPFGVTGGAFLGVWIRGFIATDPQLDWDGLPRFLVDSRTRKGQSGSPVIFYQAGGGVPMRAGGIGLFEGSVSQFIGIYSGRINAESDLGIVWKPVAIQEIVDAAVAAA